MWEALDQLAETDQGDVVRLKNIKPPEWRLRVGEIRVRFAYLRDDDVILLLRVLPRGKAYDR